MTILRWLKKGNVKVLPDRDKQHNMEMKHFVTAANEAVRPVQSVIWKKCGDYESY